MAVLCNVCKTRAAKVFYMEFVNGERREQCLCEECAANNTSMRLKNLFGDQEFSLGGLLSGMFEEQNSENHLNADDREVHPVGANLVCSGCGMTYEEFKEKGQFGCASCYQSFGKLLAKNIKSLQGADIHAGKHPKNVVAEPIVFEEEKLPEVSEIDRLTLQMQHAVEIEDYDTAAKLRDKIRALKAEGVTKE